MSDPISSLSAAGDKRKFSWMPTLDGYILRSFLVPFFILLFAFTLLFIIMDMYNEIGDFLDHEANVKVAVQFFLLKIPGNIRFILPITVLLACMYTLANLGRNRELTAIRASGISLMRCGLPIFTVGFIVMLVNFYFNEKLVPRTTREANIVKEKLSNPNYVEQTNARLQFHSGDRLRQWYFRQFDDDGYQEDVQIKFFPKAGSGGDAYQNNAGNVRSSFRPRLVIKAEKTRFIPKSDEGPGAWEFNNPQASAYPDDAAGDRQGTTEEIGSLGLLINDFEKTGIRIDLVVTAGSTQEASRSEADSGTAQAPPMTLTLIPAEKDESNLTIKSGNVPYTRDELLEKKVSDFSTLLISEKIVPDKPSVIIKSVIEPEALSSYEIFRIWMDNPHMAKNVKHIYETIFFNRLAFPWACFLCAFFALPLATKNERSGIFTAIATAVGIAVLYQVLNEVFMVIGRNGYFSFDAFEDSIHFPLGAFLAGIAPTLIFGGYGIYLLKKSG